MFIVLAISIAIVLSVLLLSVITTSKAYTYEHKIDPIEGNPHLDQTKEEGYSEEQNKF